MAVRHKETSIKKAHQAETKTIEAVLLASNWLGDSAPYTQTVEMDDVTADCCGVIGVSDTATAEQYTAAMDAVLRKTEQAEGTVTITAYEEKPTVDIPIACRIN